MKPFLCTNIYPQYSKQKKQGKIFPYVAQQLQVAIIFNKNNI